LDGFLFLLPPKQHIFFSSLSLSLSLSNVFALYFHTPTNNVVIFTLTNHTHSYTHIHNTHTTHGACLSVHLLNSLSLSLFSLYSLNFIALFTRCLTND
jgi:hypothetical protein